MYWNNSNITRIFTIRGILQCTGTIPTSLGFSLSEVSFSVLEQFQYHSDFHYQRYPSVYWNNSNITRIFTIRGILQCTGTIPTSLGFSLSEVSFSVLEQFQHHSDFHYQRYPSVYWNNSNITRIFTIRGILQCTGTIPISLGFLILNVIAKYYF